MRKVETPQLEIGGSFIEEVVINPRSRDDIPALLPGLQHLYVVEALRKRLFALLESEINPDVRKDTGRPGMDLWGILVLAILKQGPGCDRDRLCELANEHQTLRRMMGHGLLGRQYEMQTVIGNVSLLGPSLLVKVNGLLVEAGHKVAGKKPGEPLRGRCDSFCVETDVHYPTDCNLLWDAMRCTVRHAARLSGSLGLRGWRQHRHVTHGVIKRAFNRVRTARLARRSPERVEAYLAVCERYLARARETLREAEGLSRCSSQGAGMVRVRHFMRHAERQIDQIRRRVLHGESIPHGEKVFSIFEPHTRRIVKGKAGVLQELGVPVCVLEDPYQFILHHEIMWKGHDVDYATGMVSDAQKSFPELRACSLDKGVPFATEPAPAGGAARRNHDAGERPSQCRGRRAAVSAMVRGRPQAASGGRVGDQPSGTLRARPGSKPWAGRVRTRRGVVGAGRQCQATRTPAAQSGARATEANKTSAYPRRLSRPIPIHPVHSGGQDVPIS